MWQLSEAWMIEVDAPLSSPLEFLEGRHKLAQESCGGEHLRAKVFYLDEMSLGFGIIASPCSEQIRRLYLNG